MQFVTTKLAQKYINSCDRITKKRLEKSISKLPLGDVKKLKGNTRDYRLRVGDLRVIFTMEDEVITIEEVLPRGQVYNKIREEYIYDAGTIM